MSKLPNNKIQSPDNAPAASTEIANFFKSAQDLSEEEFQQVMGTLISKEARVRFSQQRKYGQRTFLQEGVDNLEGVSERQASREKQGLPVTKTGEIVRDPIASLSSPLIAWDEVPEIFKRPASEPITKEELAEAWKLLRKLRGDKDTFLETIQSL